MVDRYISGVVVLWMAWLFTTQANAFDSGQTDLALEPCHKPGFSREVLCGTVEVYENRRLASGRKIPIHFVIVPADDQTPEPDPLLFLAGGPGQAATELVAQVMPVFRRINRKRDIIFIDQRGTGESNPLKCESKRDNPWELSLQANQEFVKQCLSELNADTTQYLSYEAIDDFDEIRAALGYEQLNLYGGSYGTRAGEVYVKRHPERVRSVIFDANGPIGLTIGLHFGADAQRAMDILLDHCTNDAACNAAFPNLTRDFYQLIARLETEPVVVDVVDPLTADKRVAKIGRDLFALGLRNMLYSTTMDRVVPLVITEAAQGNLLPFVGAMGSAAAGQGAYLGLTLSVLCTEDVGRKSADDIDRQERGSFVADTQANVFLSMCEVWPKGELPQDFDTPISSDVPALILSGDWDPVTPPAYGDMMVERFSNGRHLVVPQAGHTVFSTGCVPRLIREFLEQHSAVDLDVECLNEVKLKPYFTSTLGPVSVNVEKDES